MFKINIFIFILTNQAFCEDVFYNINSKNILHKVSEKFLSISIDPAVLLAGVNLSDVSLLLAKHLSPAYIRLAGPSTPFVKYIDEEDGLISQKSEEGTNVIITPSMWFGINEWFNLADLTPVFGINDKETDKGVWDPKSTLPLLEMSDKFGVSCYWQLGYDCSNKTTVQYVEDLNILKQTLNGFPEHNDTWKIVGSDLSRCIYDELDNRNFEYYVSDLDENVDAIMWESSLVPKTELGFAKTALWTSVPKDPKPVTFSSAMQWARQVGEAAKMEYDVIFRQPRLLEITHDTSVYWFSFLHKKLMGTIVLDIRPTIEIPNLSIFAHCTKRQNNFVRSGAITILMINNGSETNTANIRLGNFMLDKSMEVQSYFLMASNESTTEVHLNNQKLVMDLLKRADDILKPKLRRAKIRGHLSLEIPPQTIGFFVLTGAKNALCINKEEDLNSILAEINEDQDLSLSEEDQFEIEGRWQDVDKGDKNINVGEKTTLQSIKKNILKELELDKSYINKMLKKQELKENLVEESVEDKVNTDRKKEILHKHLRAFIEKAKKTEVAKDLGRKRQKDKTSTSVPSPNNLHFTIKEIEDILKRRAKAKAEEKNIKLTSSELDLLVDKATIRLPKHFISKRDINAFLLEEKAKFHKNNMFSQETYERYAKEHKLFPKLQFRRSEQNYKRKRRNINNTLLNLKARLEEHKKYMLHRNNRLRSSHDHNFRGMLPRSKRDINLDLLKKRTQPNTKYGKHKVAVQPDIRSYKHFFRDQDDENVAKSKKGKVRDELFEDFLQSEERTIEDTDTSRKLFANLETSDMDYFNFDDYFKEPKRKHKTTIYSLFSKPKLNAAFPRKSTDKHKNKFDSSEFIQLLGASEEFENFDDDAFKPYSYDFGFYNDPNGGEERKFGKSWKLRSEKIGNNKKEKPLLTDWDWDTDNLNFPDSFEFGFFRKRREANSIAKKEPKIIANDVKSKARKLKKEINEDKMKYIKEKIENTIKLKKQNLSKKLKSKRLLGSKKNIQIISKMKGTKHSQENMTLNEILLSNHSKENTISDLPGNRVKRYIMTNNLNNLFGQYQPLTPSLRPWKPIDILGLQNNYFKTLPLYYWIQDQNLRNKFLQNQILGLRKRRYIENGSINSIENEILSDENKKEIGKTDFVKHEKDNLLQKENIVAQKSKFLNTNDIKIKDAGNTVISVKKTPPSNTSELFIDKMVPEEKMTYLERILGKKNTKPLEDLAEQVRRSFNNMSTSVMNFFKNLF